MLLAKKRYRFEGRLTCVVNGKRRSAPKSTRIEVLNTVGRKTVSKPATRLRASGKLNAILKTPNVSGTRTLIFRYRNSERPAFAGVDPRHDHEASAKALSDPAQQGGNER